MNLLLNLLVLCVTLNLCHGTCFQVPYEAEMINESITTPDACIDYFDKTKHSTGTQWDTADCYRCSCELDGMHCCTRYGGMYDIPGCTAVVNPETCEYEFHSVDDLTKPCV